MALLLASRPSTLRSRDDGARGGHAHRRSHPGLRPAGRAPRVPRTAGAASCRSSSSAWAARRSRADDRLRSRHLPSSATTGPRWRRADREPHVLRRGVERLAGALGDITAAGVAFPVDLRLRPGSKGSGFASSVAALARYYEEYGDLWERQTLTRARILLGDRALARAVRRELRGIVYSAPLPRTGLKEIVAVRKRMELELGKETPGRMHVKYGKGGLVDVEFLAQALALLHGADRPSVRRPNTTSALRALGPAGALTAGHADELIDHYRFLRRLHGAAAARRAAGRSFDWPVRCRRASPPRSAFPRVRRSWRSTDAARTPCAHAIARRWVSRKSFYIVDGHSAHSARTTRSVISRVQGIPSHAVLIMSTMLWKLIREEKPDYLGIALDPPGRRSGITCSPSTTTRTTMPGDSRGSCRTCGGCSTRCERRSSRSPASRPTTSSRRSPRALAADLDW